MNNKHIDKRITDRMSCKIIPRLLPHALPLKNKVSERDLIIIRERARGFHTGPFLVGRLMSGLTKGSPSARLFRGFASVRHGSRLMREGKAGDDAAQRLRLTAETACGG